MAAPQHWRSNWVYMKYFPTDYSSILARIDEIEPKKYSKTRNFIDGAVTYLSPFISRGVISTKQVYEALMAKGYKLYEIEKFVQELAWRDYWQQVWIAKGVAINQDLKNEQQPVSNHQMPTTVLEANTGITAIDQAIEGLYKTGYMHNHVRMYVAGITCNMANSHWHLPAKWMYYHLFDADWASNALSWQWVAGANANKKYVANQENINKYCHTEQIGTFLDVPYSAFDDWKVPEILKEVSAPDLEISLPKSESYKLNEYLPTAIYNWYNLDPNWLTDQEMNRVLLIEPSIFREYPISEQSMQFMLDLANNISGIQVVIAEFDELQEQHPEMEFHYKEHPLNNYQGNEHKRDWMSDVTGYHSSFFKFWKLAKREL